MILPARARAPAAVRPSRASTVYDRLVERAIIGVAGMRARLLVGEPDTATRLLSAASSGTSHNAVQSTTATTEGQIRYGLLAEIEPEQQVELARRSSSMTTPMPGMSPACWPPPGRCL